MNDRIGPKDFVDALDAVTKTHVGETWWLPIHPELYAGMKAIATRILRRLEGHWGRYWHLYYGRPTPADYRALREIVG